MKKRKQLITRILSVLLLPILLCDLIFKPLVGHAQEQPYTLIILNVISEIENNPFDGYFLVSNEKLYVADETLKKMGDIEEIPVIGVDNISTCFKRGDLEVYIQDNEQIEYDGAIYYPFAQVLGELSMRASFSIEKMLLLVEQRKDLSQLDSVLKDIYLNDTYNMSYWQNMEFFYGFSHYSAVAADIVKNFNFISYIDGTVQTERYQEVFWRMLLPEEAEDQIVFLDDTDTTMELISKFSDIEDELSSDGDDSIFGDWSEVIDLADDIQIIEVMKVYTYLRSMKEIDASYIRGLELILTKSVSDMNKEMYQAGTYTLSMYEETTPLWEAVLISFLQGCQKDLEGDVEKYIEEAILGISSIACDCAGIILDKVLNTQEQVDATLMAQCCLEIQKKCGDYYRYHRQDLHTGNKEEYAQVLRDLHDVMTLYLRAGIMAYRAVAIDDELRNSAEYAIARMNKELSTLAIYQEADFTVFTDNEKSEQQIINSKASNLFMENMDGISDISEIITVQFDWDGVSASGQLIEFEMYVESILEDGSTICLTNNDAQVFTADGSLIGEIKDNSTQTNGSIKVILYKTNGFYQFQLNTLEDGFPTNDILNSELSIIIDSPTNKNGLQEISLEDNMYRSYTGVWFWGIAIDRGNVINSNGLPD